MIQYETEMLQREEAKAWGIEEVPAPPTELIKLLERAHEDGSYNLEPVYYAERVFTKDSQFPGKGIKPNNWFWDQIAKGNIDEKAAHLKGMWALIDPTPKPNYKDGKQYYRVESEPGRYGGIGATLGDLRTEGKIKVPEWCQGIPIDSRFGVSWNEIDEFVVPDVAKRLVAKRLDVDIAQVSLLRAIEFNVAGNIYHPEWGNTNTWEWFNDSFGRGGRLVGGSSGSGGLASVDRDGAGAHHDSVGFRLQVAFPPKAV